MTLQERIRPGFKQTEAGVIPEDWEIRHLSHELDGLEAGVSVNSVDENQQSAPHDFFILKTSAVANGAFIASEAKKVAARDLRRVKTHARADTIILSRMNTPDLVGESGYVDRDYPNCFLPDRLWMTRFKRETKICVKWLSYLLTSQRYKTLVKSAATGTSGSMKNISKAAFTSILLPWPSPPEQRAIAEALGDADARIAAVEAVIAKKRDLKQAAMQQLLTGKTRLPGFSGEWVQMQLLKAVHIQQGQVDPKVEPYRKMTLIGPEHIEGEIGRLLEAGTAAEQHAISGKYEFETGDLIYGKINPHLKKVVYAPFSGICSADLYPLRPYVGVDAKFVLGILLGKTFTDYAVSCSRRSGIPKINREELAGFSFPAPPTLAEQTAIAEILSDMDADLAALEAEAAKARTIKQGMMQTLLTGQVRLA